MNALHHRYFSMQKPRHTKVDRFLKQRLFESLVSFSEFESRIAALPTTKDRGDAFEVFAEAYLATQPIVQAKDVWPFDAVPLHIKQQHLLDTGTDMGVDGVFQTRSGQFSAYQVKFRSGRPALTWAELSTFMGLTDYVAERVLFTNCDDLPGLMNERSGFFCIRGTDLDRLEPADFEAISTWLAGTPVPRKKKEPLPHQVKALTEILDAFAVQDRATTVMACGSGKTLLALWVAERMGVKNILVLVPALALLRQTLHQWLSQTSWDNIAYLCVCSDPTVEKNTDELIVRQSDLDFPVTTDSRTVKKFLEHTFEGVKIVFSTYHSARVVAEGMDTSTPFELGLFDEAHKTAGREGAGFAFALRDDNLPIQKRLFLTATPRHYDIKQKDKEGDSKLVYSMDVPEVYGSVASKLSFAEAVRLSIICDYKVIISVVTTEMVTNKMLSRGEVLIGGDAVKARQVANQLALQMAVEKHGVSKIFTFHRSVASAQSFTRQGSEGITAHLSDFTAFHVNGEMPTSRREEFMTAFRDAPKALMSNARCLTEGVDVPAVDMVAFMSPKRSRVDIVQAAGRAMRKKDGKACGYILIPLFVEQAKGETLEAALARAEFEEVWDVLQAMQEQDDVLADIISQMRAEYGKRKGYDDFRFHEKVEFLGQTFSLNILRESITTKCIERLGVAWDERYGELKAFKEQFSHCNIPQNWHGNVRLARWVNTQRSKKKLQILSPDRIQRLDELSFVWDQLDAAWEEMFEQLKDYRQLYGHCNVPARWPENSKLGRWIDKQRHVKKQNKLDAKRILRLDALGFIWEFRNAAWEEMFEQLKDYRQQYGHCNVPDKWPENPKLGIWVHKHRSFKKQNQLDAERILKLDALSFVWDPRDAAWEESFEQLKIYHQQYGHCNVPKNWADNRQLATWVQTQRQARKKNRLRKEQIQRLEDLGFVWEPNDEAWEELIEQLKEYRQQYGHCRVPQQWTENSQLSRWVSRQRQARKKKQTKHGANPAIRGFGLCMGAS